jgi:hypothetical protein
MVMLIVLSRVYYDLVHFEMGSNTSIRGRRRRLLELSLFEKFLYVAEHSLRGDSNNEYINPMHFEGSADGRAIVTFLCGGTSELVTHYEKTLRAFAYSLRKTGYDGEILILHTPEFPLTTIASSIEQFHLRTLKVPRVSIGDEGHRYENMMTKLHIWSLIHYSQLIYYDVDKIFLQNPITAFASCGNSTDLCAVFDQGIEDFQIDLVVPVEKYFNAGFLVLKPDVAIHKMLMGRVFEASIYPFVEQDLLNKVFQEMTSLMSKYIKYANRELSRAIMRQTYV